MSLKSSLLALANNIGMCQENARSIKQALAGGLAEAGAATMGDWALVKTETGATSIAIAEGTSDIYVEVTDDINTIILGLTIPLATLGTSAKNFRAGYYLSSSSNGFAQVNITNAAVVIDNVKKNGSDITATAKISVYAR